MLYNLMADFLYHDPFNIYGFVPDEDYCDDYPPAEEDETGEGEDEDEK